MYRSLGGVLLIGFVISASYNEDDRVIYGKVPLLKTLAADVVLQKFGSTLQSESEESVEKMLHNMPHRAREILYRECALQSSKKDKNLFGLRSIANNRAVIAAEDSFQILNLQHSDAIPQVDLFCLPDCYINKVSLSPDTLQIACSFEDEQKKHRLHVYEINSGKCIVNESSEKQIPFCFGNQDNILYVANEFLQQTYLNRNRLGEKHYLAYGVQKIKKIFSHNHVFSLKLSNLKDYFFVDIVDNNINPLLQMPATYFKYHACSQSVANEKIGCVDPRIANEAIIASLHEYGLEIITTLTLENAISISCMAFDSSDKYVLLGGDLFDHSIHCWNIERNEYLWRSDIPDFAPLKKIWWQPDRIYIIPCFSGTYVLKHPHYCIAVLIKKYWDLQAKEIIG